MLRCLFFCVPTNYYQIIVGFRQKNVNGILAQEIKTGVSTNRPAQWGDDISEIIYSVFIHKGVSMQYSFIIIYREDVDLLRHDYPGFINDFTTLFKGRRSRKEILTSSHMYEARPASLQRKCTWIEINNKNIHVWSLVMLRGTKPFMRIIFINALIIASTPVKAS